ncbi:gamma-aminobutyraldehyde dehydrogenase [Conexibacter woesei]|uniref:Salicylaldehyde dehydrogenase n=1 Tax=Conexibacter woesei (strain DSM 14684 / CCUG 47730 / CIP 108061 / JCM 11494 / NBRC 100937 / ID131577) TaxID=469383 RepID=D3F5V2_CONWI|nr:gamma-aminobutyraldehyde dehydrogenase [Conexibacter woesei]ADB52651.1 Aminobutyraldehyde dehydrogenase [Conexibacter woesei DSM 14684]
MATPTTTPLGTVDGAPLDESGATLPVIDPSTEELLAEVPVASAATVDRAVLAAERAFDGWADTTPAQRDDLMNALADQLAAHREEFAALEARNVGKPLEAARDEVDACVAELRYFGGAARTIEGKAAAEYVAGRTSFIRRDPVGVVAQITPWNYPLQMAIWKIGPALAAGNTVVMKPSELTPLSTLRLGELAREVLPAGVFNVVPGDGQTTGDALVRHPRVRMACLTGDVGTGRKIAANAAETVKRVHLELGGKAPVIVFDDADMDQLAETLRVASYWNAGQDCTAACRVLVSDKRYDDLLSALVPQVESLRIGGPFDASGDAANELGPVISDKQRQRVLGFLDRADADGAEIVTGGAAANERGWFVAPTIVGGVTQESEIVRREVFGPVITVQRVTDEAQALAWANDVEYGLSASVWSRDIGRCLRMAKKLQFGCVWLNDHLTVADEMPHGGYKQSGYGKDLSPYSIDDYTVVKHVMARID